ncbi:hypothetical protein BU26DRAFT_607184 [Trematosphaeria pertusa]|uniref:Uncharacterized protein n=1 Tax=Trematosphaeria pertusa TaxID=390896 RepID=A0A6A6I8M4_9PLEO|nr:uncharacterized protein BU26DRAFT_607184 [Trematosphaeria pertusa]KAF2245880.1 hypothetical protein BU26DRAFT_607184 [Trematosphaeria pertusa]
MLRKTLLRPTRLPLCPHKQLPRRYATQNPPPPLPTSQSRIERFNRRLPRFLHKYTNALASAPLSHITSFLILHELTAIVPLLGLAATFHYTHWLPSWFAEGAWVLQGVERFGKYFRRKGWIRNEDASEAEMEVQLRKRDRAWNIGEGGVRVVVEFATAYAVTKMLLPVRIVASVSATPWFARRCMIPVMGRVKRLFGRGKANSKARESRSRGMETGAVDAGAVPKNSGKGAGP